MAGGVGNLTVGLGLDYAQYTAGLTKAQRQAEQFSQRFKASFAGNFAAGFAQDFVRGLAAIPGQFVGIVKGAIDAADHLNDLSKRTGVAVETLGGIGFAASQAGSSLDGASDAIGKLNLTLAKAASGSKEASDALKALGVQAVDPLTGRTTEVDKALVQMANTFEKAAASPEKFRAAAGALGKQYKELVPLLEDGGQALLANIAYYQRFGGVTTDTAEKADKFNDELGKIRLLTESFGRSLAAELLTPLTGIAQAFLNAKEKGDGFRGVASGIKDALVGIASTASFVVNSLEAIGARLSGLIAKGEILGEAASKARERTRGFDIFGSSAVLDSSIGAQFAKVDEDTKARVASAQKSYDDFVKHITEGGATPAAPKKTARIPGIPDASQAAEAEAALKKILDGQLRQIRAFADQQKDALAFANEFLKGEYQDGLIALATFFGDQKNIRDAALRAQLQEQDKIIAAEEEFARRTTNKASQIDALNRVREAQEAKTRAIVRAGQEEQLVLQQNARDVKALADSFKGVNAQVLELQENFAAAAAARFDLQNFEQRRTFSANVNSPDPQVAANAAQALRNSDALRAATIAQAAFQKATLESSRTLQDLANQEDRIAIARQAGALTSIEALARVGDARRQQIAVLERQVAAEEALAAIEKARGTLGADDLVRRAERSRIALDQLKASADPLAESLNKVFGDDLNSALDDFVTGTKSASDAFKSFADSVLKDILRMGTKSLTEEIFGGSGGIGKALSDLFKNSGSSGGLVAAIKGAFGGSSGGDLGESGGMPTQSAIDELTKVFSSSGAKASETASIASTTGAMTGLTTAATAAATALSSLATQASASSLLPDTSKLLAPAPADDGIDAALNDYFRRYMDVAGEFTTATAAQTAAVTQTTDAFDGLGDETSLLGSLFSQLAQSDLFSSAVSGVADAAGEVDWADLLSSFAGFFAGGGQIMPGQWGVVGENGPELAFGGRTGQTIQPAGGGAAPVIHNNYVTVQGAPNQSRDSAIQQGAAIGLGIQQSMARNS
jgi:hypothetical protein